MESKRERKRLIKERERKERKWDHQSWFLVLLVGCPAICSQGLVGYLFIDRKWKNLDFRVRKPMYLSYLALYILWDLSENGLEGSGGSLVISLSPYCIGLWSTVHAHFCAGAVFLCCVSVDQNEDAHPRECCPTSPWALLQPHPICHQLLVGSAVIQLLAFEINT